MPWTEHVNKEVVLQKMKIKEHYIAESEKDC